MTTALVLSGGGARAAYQVGVLKALAQILPRTSHNPFPIICGTSAGAINALAIAGRPGPFRLRARKLEAIWRNMHAGDIYRTDAWGVLKNTLRLGLSFMHSGYGVGRSVALLDNSPLQHLLTNYIRFRHIDEAILSGDLMAVSTTAMDYDTGKSVAFFQGNHDCWTRSRRHGIRTGLSIDHLMASSAIPLIFPARAIDSRFYGDGAMRQLKPLSPALHLGADRIFIIGVSDNPSHQQATDTPQHSPSVAQMIGHLLNSAFIDSVESDLETLKAINKLVESQAKDESEEVGESKSPLKYIEHLCISPSTPIDEIAQEYFHELPQSVKLFLRAIGATKKGGGSSATSYLLFEPGFCRELIKLGYADAMAQEDKIRAFFGLDGQEPVELSK
ncbi:patatin [Gammaproteobacteria bacterium 50_400_T64]|nr:patatin [Gammaproteobacteria bacterium 50_400_T64]